MARSKTTAKQTPREERAAVAAKTTSKKGLKTKKETVVLVPAAGARKSPRFTRRTVGLRGIHRVSRHPSKLYIGKAQWRRLVEGALDFVNMLGQGGVTGIQPEVLEFTQSAFEARIAKIFENAFEQRVDGYTPGQLAKIRKKGSTIQLQTENFVTAARQLGNAFSPEIADTRKQIKKFLKANAEEACNRANKHPKDKSLLYQAQMAARAEHSNPRVF